MNCLLTANTLHRNVSAMKRRPAGGVRRGETTPVYVRLDRKTRNRIEDILEEYQFRDRSHFVLASVRAYLDQLEEEDVNVTEEADDAAVRSGRTLSVYVRLDGKTLD